MKRNLTVTLCIGSLFLLIAATVLIPQPVSAQGPVATLTVIAPTPQPAGDSPDLSLENLKKAADDAVASANQAMNTVNLMLAFIQVAGLLGGALIGLTGVFLARSGFRTLQEYQKDLDDAREQLRVMTLQLDAQAETVRVQFQKAVRASSLLQLGEQQLEAKNMTSALRTYETAYKLDPDNPATNYFLGYIYTQERQLDKGIDHLKRALDHSGTYPPAQAALAYALRLKADRISEPIQRKATYAESEQMFLRALDEDSSVLDIDGESVYAVLGGLYKKQNRVEDAINAYEAAIQITPQNSYPVINLAMLEYTQGDVEKAEHYFRRSAPISIRKLDGNPFDYWPRFDLTLAQLVTGQFDDAKRNFAIAAQQVTNAGHLEVFLSDLQRLKNSPRPPANIDEMIELVTRSIDRLNAKNS